MTAVAALSLDGVDQVIEKFGGLRDRLARPEPAFEIIADNLELHVAQQFATQGARVGKPWAPLAPSTVRARRRRWGYYRRPPTASAGPAGPILSWTGDLAASFRQGSPLHIRAITATSLTWGSADPKAIYHQSTLPRRRLPRRPPIDFRSEFEEREIAFTPLRLWLQGVPAGAIATVSRARLSL